MDNHEKWMVGAHYCDKTGQHIVDEYYLGLAFDFYA